MSSSVPLQKIEAARLCMLEARRALEEFEKLNGFSASAEHTRLNLAFTKATQYYLKLTSQQHA